MEKKYQLVAWTENVRDGRNVRLDVVPSVENELIEAYANEVEECRRRLKKNGGRMDRQTAERFVRVYEQSARFDILVGNMASAIRFLLLAADYCIFEDDLNWAYYDTDLGHYSRFCGELREDFVRLCEEALTLAREHGFEHILNEEASRHTLKLYLEHTREEREMERYLKLSGRP